jgi:hypothetical protein
MSIIEIRHNPVDNFQQLRRYADPFRNSTDGLRSRAAGLRKRGTQTSAQPIFPAQSVVM